MLMIVLFMCVSVISSFLQASSLSQSSKTYDVIIVGAGMAGLYCGYTLNEQSKDASFLILEKQGRAGGRIDSELISFPDGTIVREEDGGMRFTLEYMENVAALLLEFNLTNQVVPFFLDSNGNNRRFIRNCNRKVLEYQKNPSKLANLYNIQKDKFISTEELQMRFLKQILQQNSSFVQEMGFPNSPDPDYWTAFAQKVRYNNLPVDHFLAIDWLRLIGLDEGSLQLASTVFKGVPSTHFKDFFQFRTPFYTLNRGYDQLANALFNQVANHVRLNQTVTRIEPTPQGLYRVVVQTAKKELIYETKKVILAIPHVALVKLLSNSPLFKEVPQKKEKLFKNLDSVRDIPFAKLNFFYSSAWWTDKEDLSQSVLFGPSRTDSPLVSIFPFYAINDPAFIATLDYVRQQRNLKKEIPSQVQQKIDNIRRQTFQRPAALTFYVAFGKKESFVNFWRKTQQSSVAFKPLFTTPKLNPASQFTVRFAQEMAQEVLLKKAPLPDVTSVTIWDGQPAEFVDFRQQEDVYAIHLWAPQVNQKKVIEELIEPLKNIYICGESYSDYQGWVEGALRSSNLVLKKGFDLLPLQNIIIHRTGQTPSQLLKKAYKKQAQKRIQSFIENESKG